MTEQESRLQQVIDRVHLHIGRFGGEEEVRDGNIVLYRFPTIDLALKSLQALNHAYNLEDVDAGNIEAVTFQSEYKRLTVRHKAQEKNFKHPLALMRLASLAPPQDEAVDN
jgi:hypothetical protein